MIKKPDFKKIAENIFNRRGPIIILLAAVTAFLGYQASQLEVSTDFTKMIPQDHPYMKAYSPYKENFGGGNQIKIEVSLKEGTVVNTQYLKLLKKINEDVMFVKGIDRLKVQSLVSPQTIYVSINEEGFDMGQVVPDNIPETEEGLAKIDNNIKIARLQGRMVSMDMKSSLITAEVFETGVDYFSVYQQLNEIRDKYSGGNVSLHINGFAMVMGFVNDALPRILGLFFLAAIITFLILWRYFKKLRLALLPVSSGAIAVLWSLGISRLIGMQLDPMTTIVPFLVFAIGVSHGIQMINRFIEECRIHPEGYDAARSALSGLLLPGSAALSTDVVGFLAIMFIPIGVIRELAISASLGVACIIIANLLAISLTLSFYPNVCTDEGSAKSGGRMERFLQKFSKLTSGENATKAIVFSAMLLIIGIASTMSMAVGDVNPGEPLLWEDSTYNKDAEKMMKDFMFGTDSMSVVVDGEEDGTCKKIEVLRIMDDFEWEIGKIPGVTFIMSPIILGRIVNEMFHEGNIRWRALPKIERDLGAMLAMGGSTDNSDFMNMGCKYMNIRIFLSDHKGDTIRRVIKKAKEFIQANPLPCGAKFVLAGGNAGVMAATNEEVADAQVPMLLLVYISIFVLVFVSYRKIKATLFIILPLILVSVLASAFMQLVGLGLNVNTLPVAAIGVGIGVDYGIYIYSRLKKELSRSENFEQAVLTTFRTTGTAVIVTAGTLCVGVLTWLLSELKFQADMGLLLGFIFLVNMLGAMILLPSLVYVFDYKKKN